MDLYKAPDENTAILQGYIPLILTAADHMYCYNAPNGESGLQYAVKKYRHTGGFAKRNVGRWNLVVSERFEDFPTTKSILTALIKTISGGKTNYFNGGMKAASNGV